MLEVSNAVPVRDAAGVELVVLSAKSVAAVPFGHKV